MLLFILTKYLLIYHLPSTAWLQCYSVRQYYRECLTGYKTGLGYKTWSFPFPLMTSRRERGFLKHVKASPQEVEIKSSRQISLWLLQISLFFCYLKSCSYINQWEVKCFKGKNPQRYYRQFHNLFLHIRPPKPSWSYL